MNSMRGATHPYMTDAFYIHKSFKMKKKSKNQNKSWNLLNKKQMYEKKFENYSFLKKIAPGWN